MNKVELTQISPTGFRQIVKEEVSIAVKKAVSELLEDKVKEIYNTTKQISKRFDVDPSTVFNWKTKGVLKAVQLGGRVYFKESDIQQAIIELKIKEKTS